MSNVKTDPNSNFHYTWNGEFLLKFRRNFFKLEQVHLHPYTAYHPQTDGQTEVVNRGLECYLRCFAGARPKE